jgi:NADPH:quinone reductase-like Zn-dependent oxidoreductase
LCRSPRGGHTAALGDVFEQPDAGEVKAVVFTQYGPPEVLRVQDVGKPEPRPGQVLVKVRTAAVNDWDWCFVRGKPHLYRLMMGLFRPKLSVLGAEIAGTVEAVGEGATRFHPGDEVYGDISEAGFGGFAEYVCVSEDAVVPKPAGMSFEQAVAIPHAAGLALQGLVDVGGIRRGDSVLINGAGGGVGTLGVQIAKERGAALVTGVDSGPKLEMMRAAGFDRVIDYDREDFTQNGQRYDLILDTKTNRSPLRYLRSLRGEGRYVTVGGHLSRLIQVLCVGGLVRRFSQKTLRIVALKPNKDLSVIHDLFERGRLELVIDGPHPLSAVPQAVRRFGEACHLGKVVISVAQG